MRNIFTEHPKSVGESYFKHLYHAFSFSLLLLTLSAKAFIHAILPFLYITTVSDKIKSLSEDMQRRRSKGGKN